MKRQPGSCLFVKLLEKQSQGVKVTRSVTFLQLKVNCKALFANDIGENCRVVREFYNRTQVENLPEKKSQ